jgi:hypothetical protein
MNELSMNVNKKYETTVYTVQQIFKIFQVDHGFEYLSWENFIRNIGARKNMQYCYKGFLLEASWEVSLKVMFVSHKVHDKIIIQIWDLPSGIPMRRILWNWLCSRTNLWQVIPGRACYHSATYTTVTSWNCFQWKFVPVQFTSVCVVY